jgi:hypothetical protein
MHIFIYCCFLGCMQDTSYLGNCVGGFILVKLILPLSSLIHCHIIKSDYMTAYLMPMKPPPRPALVITRIYTSPIHAEHY